MHAAMQIISVGNKSRTRDIIKNGTRDGIRGGTRGGVRSGTRGGCGTSVAHRCAHFHFFGVKKTFFGRLLH